MVKLDKNNKDKPDTYYLTAKEVIALILTTVIMIAGTVTVILLNDSSQKVSDNVSGQEVNNNIISSVTCTVEDAETVQTVDTKPDNHIVVDSDGKSKIIYDSSQQISQSYYVYLKDNEGDIFQFSVTDDVYAAMSRKKGDIITIDLKKELFGNFYYWQGQRLENLIKITNSES